MKIHAHFEGGGGDMICANRLAYGILKKYPNEKIHIFSNTDGNSWQTDFIISMWSSMYSEVTQVRRKDSKINKVISQFGEENITSLVSNIVEEDYNKMMDCDKFYDLHIDSLKFLDYSECRQTLNYFPPVEKKLEYNWDHFGKYLLMHPMSRLDGDRKLELFYIKRLIKDFATKIPVVIITEDKHLPFYDFCDGWENVTVISTDLYQSWDLIQKAEAFIGVDSVMAHMAKSSGKPYYVFNNYCQKPFTAPAFQSIRWINPLSCLPPNFDSVFVVKSLMGCIDNYSRFLYPEFSSNIDQATVQRIFIDKEEKKI